MSTTTYTSPVDKLLTLGKPEPVLLLEMFKEISASRAKLKETPSPSPEESYISPPARTTTDKIIKFSGKRVTKKKSKKKR